MYFDIEEDFGSVYYIQITVNESYTISNTTQITQFNQVEPNDTSPKYPYFKLEYGNVNGTIAFFQPKTGLAVAVVVGFTVFGIILIMIILFVICCCYRRYKLK